MLRINQTLMTDDEDLMEVEQLNHNEDAFEYLPEAKERTYMELANGEATLFLSIKITDTNGEAKEQQLIDGQAYMAMIACTMRVFNRHKDIFETLSISFQRSLNKLRSEGLFINALILPESQNLLNDFEIVKLEKELSEEIGIIPKENTKNINNTKFNNKSEIENKIKDLNKNKVNNKTDTRNEYKKEFQKNFKNNNNNNKTDNIFKNSNNITKSETDEINKINNNKTDQNKEKNNSKITNNSSKMKIHKTGNFDVYSFLKKAQKDNNKNKNIERNISIAIKSNEEQNKELDKYKEKINVTNENIINENKRSSVKDNLEIEDNPIADKNAATINKNINNRDNSSDNINSINENEDDNVVVVNDENYQEKASSKSETATLCFSDTISEDMRERLNELAKDKNAVQKIKDSEDEYILKQNGDLSFFQSENDNIEQNEPFIKTFCSKYGYDNIPEEQKNAYANASTDIPFLNSIDDYIPESNILHLEEPAPIYELHDPDEFVQTTASKQKLKRAFEKTMRYFMENEITTMRRVLRGEREEEDFLYDIEEYVKKYCQIPREDMKLFINKLKRAMFSYYVLTPAINDPNVSDIRVLAPNNINVKVHGDHFTASDLKFIDKLDYFRFIEGLIIKNNVPINNAILVFTDKNFHPDYILRFNLCLPNINSTGMPYLHIRKVPKEKTTLKNLIDAKMLTPKVAKYLLDKVQTSRGIVFSGPSASGKTTLQNALVDYIPKDKSILCIQESEEMFSHIHPNAYFQHMLKDPQGNTIIGLSELGQNGLLCDVGYFIIGECKGAEVRDLLRASNTGHKCWCTVHAQSSKETIARLADYVKYGSDYTFDEATRMLKDLEVIVYIENFKVKEISEIIGYDEEKKDIVYRTIYKNPAFFKNIEK